MLIITQAFAYLSNINLSKPSSLDSMLPGASPANLLPIVLNSTCVGDNGGDGTCLVIASLLQA